MGAPRKHHRHSQRLLVAFSTNPGVQDTQGILVWQINGIEQANTGWSGRTEKNAERSANDESSQLPAFLRSALRPPARKPTTPVSGADERDPALATLTS